MKSFYSDGMKEMSRIKGKRPTFHAIMRSKERTKYKDKAQFTKQAKLASKNGKCPLDFEGEFRNYLLRRSRKKRVKVYDGYVWIFNKNSDRAITVYEIPEQWRELK